MRVGQIQEFSYMRVALACLVVCLAVNGCTNVDGGAVELSWKLRPASGSTTLFVECATGVGTITRVRLDWQVGSTTGFTSWNCTDYHGVTGFDLPPGVASLSISPECLLTPADTHTYTAPAPEQ